jgi:hypothetical protein
MRLVLILLKPRKLRPKVLLFINLGWKLNLIGEMWSWRMIFFYTGQFWDMSFTETTWYTYLKPLSPRNVKLHMVQAFISIDSFPSLVGDSATSLSDFFLFMAFDVSFSFLASFETTACFFSESFFEVFLSPCWFFESEMMCEWDRKIKYFHIY